MALVDEATEHYLEQWGRWCRCGGYGPADAKSWHGPMVDRLNMTPIDRTSPYDADDDVMDAFDRRVMRHLLTSTAKGSTEAYKILRDYYRGVERKIDGRVMFIQKSAAELAKDAKIGRTLYNERLRSAINRVLGMLEVMTC